MGEVYKALDTRLDRAVAIKVLSTETSADPDRQGRFEREAKTVASLAHPHICTLHDVGEHASSMFLVMEHLEGETLARRLAKGPLLTEQALEIGTRSPTHFTPPTPSASFTATSSPPIFSSPSRGKPRCWTSGWPRSFSRRLASTDAKATRINSEHLTLPGTVIGTVAYMAPEQARGWKTDARTDVWSLGVVLYEMIAGRVPFEGETTSHVIVSILEHEPARLTRFAPDAPAELQRIVRKCLAKDSQRALPDGARSGD